jgi:hypothetical protein
MGEFTLKTKDGESINTIKASNIDEAKIMFAEVKRLKPNELVKIYNVEELN